MLRPIDAPANEDTAVAIEQHHADAGAIGKILKAHLGTGRQRQKLA
jgi:hypothetical protein